MKQLLAISLLVLVTLPASATGPERVEGGWYDTSFPVPVMHLEGSIEEVARAHGAILGRHPELKETLVYFGSVAQDRLNANARLAPHPLLKKVAGWAYRHFIRNLLVDHVPERYQKAFEDFAKAAGVEEDLVWDALVLPDAALRSAALLYGFEAAPVLPPSFGCTSIIWNSGHSSVLHGRNLDYEGVGYWDRHPIVMHVIPNEGLAYVSVTAMGMHAPGITAFNEAGLTLAIHQLTLKDTQASGTPVAIISAEVIRNARSIDDAITIIRGFPRAGGWAYVLSQGRDRAVVETSASEVAIRRSSEPFFFQTNHVSSPALASNQIFFSAGAWLDTFTRAARLTRISQSPTAIGWATPERLAPLLGMGVVPGMAPPPHRIAGGTIAKLDNIQSVIMDASHRRLWVAVGTSKLAPNENTYLEYRWSDLRSADAPELTGAEVTLFPKEVLGESGARLRELLRSSMNRKQLAAAPRMRDALLASYARLAQDSQKSGPAFAGRWPGLYLHVWEQLRQAELTPQTLSVLLHEIDFALKDSDLTTSTTAGDVARATARHRLAVGRLTRGRVLDLMGQRSQALHEYYRVHRTAEFERLRKAADLGMRRAFDVSAARTLAIDWGGIDLFQY